MASHKLQGQGEEKNAAEFHDKLMYIQFFFFSQSNCSFDKDATPRGRARSRREDERGDQHRVPFSQLRETETPLRHLYLVLE